MLRRLFLCFCIVLGVCAVFTTQLTYAIDAGGIRQWGYINGVPLTFPASTNASAVAAGERYTAFLSDTETVSTTATDTPSITLTPSMTRTPSLTRTRSRTVTATKTPTRTRTYTSTRTRTRTKTRTPTKTAIPTMTRNPEDPNQAILNGAFDKNVVLPYPQAYGWKCMVGGLDGQKPWREGEFCWMSFDGAAPLQPPAGQSYIMQQRIYIPRAYTVLKISYFAINSGIPCSLYNHNAMFRIGGSTKWQLQLCKLYDTGYDSNGYPKTVIKNLDLSAYKGTWQTLDIIVSQRDGASLTFGLFKVSFR